jgi:amiloride-sensitive sodium channel
MCKRVEYFFDFCVKIIATTYSFGTKLSKYTHSFVLINQFIPENIITTKNERIRKILKYFWTCVILSSICGLSFYTRSAFIKLNIQPDIGLTVTLRPSREIPFPAFTICSGILPNELQDTYKMHPYTYFENVKNKKTTNNLTSDQQNDFAAYTQMCREIVDTNFVMDKICNNRSEKNVIEMLKKFDYLDYDYDCSFRGLYVSCSKSYSRSLTDYGICYTFNIQGYHTIFNDGVISDDFDLFKHDGRPKFLSVVSKKYSELIKDGEEEVYWTLEDGYKTSSDEIMPFRASQQNDFSSTFCLNETKAELKLLNYCTTINFGYKIIFHLPNEIPSNLHQHTTLPAAYSKTFAISGKSYKMDKNLQKFHPNIRDCYFEGEKKLKYFKTYTKINCDYECMANYTLIVCGCVKFSMPRGHDTPVCDLDKTKCYTEAMASWPNLNNSLMTCDCLQPCNDVKYKFDTVKYSSLFRNPGQR